jgi:ADP-ribosylglycohydrolase
VCHEFDTEDMGGRFLRWYRGELWTPHGKVFDVGVSTARALQNIANGVRAEVAGETGQFSNGNGSLMRILPVSLRFATDPIPRLLDRVHCASAITHRHVRSQMACGLFTLVVRELLTGEVPREAFAKALAAFRSFYEPDPWWSLELDYFQLLLADDLDRRPESDIGSGGYVLETLPASLWCLLTTSSFEECVLKAVNLGHDTDTTGCVAGGLAGVHYGLKAIPEKWLQTLARHDDVKVLFNQFEGICPVIG